MTLQRAALWAIVIAATLYLLVAGRGLLLPFVLGIVLWYMVSALAEAFEHPKIGHLRLPRPIALVAAVCVMGGLLWVVGRTIGRNISASPPPRPTTNAGCRSWSTKAHG
jgi:predicted PurR-regulated permease PerM